MSTSRRRRRTGPRPPNPAMEAATAAAVNPGLVAGQSRLCRPSGKPVVEQAAQEADARQRQDDARDAVQQDEMALAEGFAKDAGAQADADPPDQRAEEDARDEHRRASERRLLPGEPDAGENAEEGQDGHRIGDRQDEGREIGAEQVLGVLLGRLATDDPLAQRAGADIDEEEAAGQAQPILIAEKKIGDDGQAETGDDAEDGIGARRAEAGEEAEEPSLEDGAADAEHADGPDRHGDDEADGDAFQKKQEQHGAAGSGPPFE